jgi:hypothetical protein
MPNCTAATEPNGASSAHAVRPDDAVRILEAALAVEQGLLDLISPTQDQWAAMHSVPRGAVAPTWVCRAVDIYRGSTWGDVADELLAVAQEPHSWDAFGYGDEPPADPTRGAAASGPFKILLHYPPDYPDAERIHGIVAEYMGAMVSAIGIRAAFWRLCEAAGDGLIAANCALSPLMEESIDAYATALGERRIDIYLVTPDEE